MDVFISWSGPQSKQVAETLHHYLPLMINAIQPWLSSADIDAGARWASDIAGKLQQSKVGIICLTPTNLDSIWIHFEAGALAKTLDNTFVCPYLVGVQPSDVKGPLTQFQAKRANEEDTKRLLETLNSALGENAVKADQLAEAFSMCWPKLKTQLDAVQKAEPPAEKRSERDMLEELLELTRRQARPAQIRITNTQLPPRPRISQQQRQLVETVVKSILGDQSSASFTYGPEGNYVQISDGSGTHWGPMPADDDNDLVQVIDTIQPPPTTERPASNRPAE
jgi:hypothetical protein